MLPNDLRSALVRITADDPRGEPVGTGFVCYRQEDGILILTCRHVVEQAADSRDFVWINGEYQATLVAESIRKDGIDLAVLKCTAKPLLARPPLPLGQLLSQRKARIIHFGRLTAREQERVYVTPYDIMDEFDMRGGETQVLASQPSEILLLNIEDFPIGPGHSGSPVLDENWVVGVVTDFTADVRSPTGRNDALILATPVEQLARQWKAPGRPLDLITDPLRAVEEFSNQVRRMPSFRLRILIAGSEPTEDADVNNELAFVQETMQRRLPRSLGANVWEWGTSQCPPPESFDAVIFIVGGNLGRRGFGLEELESKTRPVWREGRMYRLIYHRKSTANGHASNRLELDRAEAFLENLKEEGISHEAYESEQFADRFGRDFQRLLARLGEAPPTEPLTATAAAGTVPAAAALTAAPATFPVGAAEPRRNPYLGLDSYSESEEDAKLFHGREKETTQLRDILARNAQRFVMVVGASGSGKSSLIRAGLFRRLKLNGIPGSTGWRKLEMRLSKSQAPLKTAADMLLKEISSKLTDQKAADLELELGDPSGVAKAAGMVLEDLPPGARLVLFIDQFEELFTLVNDENHRLTLLRFLRDAASHPRVNVVVTLRADFYARFLERGVSEIVGGHYAFWVAAPEEQALVEAMYWPAAICGYRFEDTSLFVQILRDAKASLPLLSYALHQLARLAGKNSEMSWAAYNQIGRVQGVVQRQADEAISGLDPKPGRDTLGNLFRGLIAIDENGTPTRKYAVFDPEDGTWTEQANEMKKALVEKRLLVTDQRHGEPVIEIAHEALLSSWKDLANWIAEAKEALVLAQSVERATREWREEREKAADEVRRLEIDRDRLWRQDRIDDVHKKLEVLGAFPGGLSPDAQEFLGRESVRLVKELRFAIHHEWRDRSGRRLAELKDPRPGVGVKNGVPEIVWCPVPGGRVTLKDAADQVIGTARVPTFYIAQYPITLKQFNIFANDGKTYFRKEWWAGPPINADDHPPYPQTPEVGNHPAQFVSWYQAMAFCKWLSRVLGSAVRLPTEWEWVQAFTGGRSDYTYPWGREWDPFRANHRGGAGHLTSVGMYPQGASPVGALDMSGNMYEWCLSEYDNPTNVKPSKEPRTTRGGAWFLPPPGSGGKLITVEEQLSVRHRLRDNADGFRDDGRRVAVCMRLACRALPPDALVYPLPTRA